MKFLFFFNGDFNEGNGSNARLKCYGKGLLEKGIASKFFVVRPSEFADSGINQSSKGKVQNLPFEYLTGNPLRESSKVKRFFGLLKAWKNAIRVLSNSDSNNTVLYFYSAQLFTHLPILLAVKIFGFKAMVELTELHSLKVERNPTLTFIARLNNSFIEWTIPIWFNRVYVASHRLKLFYMLRFQNIEVEILPVVYDFERFTALSIIKKTQRIGYLGSFAPKDGVESIVAAYSIAKKQIPDLRLRLIGFQTKGFNLNQVLSANGLSIHDKSIEITGQVESNRIPQLLADCDLLIMNRNNDPFANYGFPIKLAEYLATGRPVISTDVSDISRLFTTELKIIEPNNLAKLHSTIIERYKNREQ
ncbi:MAG: glycosyltransferase, partial [Bacteroidia bacterium]